MTDTQHDIQWYIARDGKQHGPLSESEMNLFVKDGHLKPTDLLWKAGFPDWKPAHNVFPHDNAAITPTPSKPAEQPQRVAAKAVTSSQPSSQSHDNASAEKSTVNLSSRARATQPTNARDGSLGKVEPTLGSPNQMHGQHGVAPAQNGAARDAHTSQHGLSSTNGTGTHQGAPNRAVDPTAPFAPNLRHPTGQSGAQTSTQDQGYATRQIEPSFGQNPAETRSGTNPEGGALHAPFQGQLNREPHEQNKSSPKTTKGAKNSGSQKRTAKQQNVSRRNGASAIQVLVTVAAIGFVSGAAYFGYTYSEKLTSIASSMMPNTADVKPNGQPPVVSPKKNTKTAATTPADLTPQIDAQPTNQRGTTPVSVTSIDSQLQKSALWTLLKSEYPDWYSERLKQASTLSTAGEDPIVIKKLLAEIVELRRKHANDALAATPQKLEGIAAAFLTNLNRLSEHSTEACYTFISKGELSPQVVELMTTTAYRPLFEAQTTRIFEAISEGRKSPIKRERANKEDFNVLARQLKTMGWTQTDLQLFANPRAFAAAPPARVCKLVKDWFAAHIALSDSSVKDRLLFETLRPVVAG